MSEEIEEIAVENTNSTAPVEKDNMAVIAYLTLIGFIIAIIKNQDKKDPLVSYHLAQMMGLLISSVVLSFIPFVNFVSFVFHLVLWIIGLMSANKGEMKPVPVLGPLYEKWFGNTFK